MFSGNLSLWRAFVGFSVATIGLGCVSAGAEEAQTGEASSVVLLEEVVVTGVKDSLRKALAIKRRSLNFVDALSVEDIGKLPDKNVAEALQRVTGVAIQRDRGEGDFVSIRGLGPDFVRGTMNGRTIVSGTETFDSTLSGGRASRTGRATNFDILPSEVVDSLQVIKSPSAEHVEGGIGGVVNIKTVRPLELGRMAAGSAQGTYREFNGKLDPEVSGLYSWVNDRESFGVLGAVSFSTRNLREDFDRSFGWLSWSPGGASDYYDTDGDGVANSGFVPFLPLSNNLDSYEEKRDRLSFNGSLQWSLDDNTDVVLDVLYTERQLKHSQTSAILVALPVDNAILNADGSYPAFGKLDGNFLQTISSQVEPELVSDEQDNNEDLVILGLNLKRQLANNWRLNVDAAYAKAKGDLAFDRSVIVGDGQGDGGAYHFNYQVDRSGFTIAYDGTADLSDPANYFVRNGRVTRTSNDDEEYAFQADVIREFDDGLVQAVKAGFRYRNREKSLDRSDFDGNLGRPAGLNPAGRIIFDNFRLTDVGSSSFDAGSNDFLDGGWGPLSYSDFIFSDIAATLAEAASRGVDIAPKFDPLGSFSTEERTIAGYLQADVGGEVAGVGFFGNVGLRIVSTDQDIGGYAQRFVINADTFPAQIVKLGDIEEVAFDDDYTNVLPSMNLRFDLAEGVLLRLSLSKSLTRPTFNDMSPQININPQATADLNGDGVAVVGTLGNPGLKPYDSFNADVGLEWYFNEDGALYQSVFYKSIDDFIAVSTALNVPVQGQVFDSASRPENQGEASVLGAEFGYQQAFANGLGYVLNVTVTDNDAEYANGGDDIAYPGVSDVSYNLIGYYESGAWSARIGYSYRSDFLLIAQDVFANAVDVEGYGQLDASVSYDVTDQLALFVSGVNLTSATPDMTTSIAGEPGKRFLSRSEVGMRISFGVRARF